jgi:uncharacterized membrane-anchored protein
MKKLSILFVLLFQLSFFVKAQTATATADTPLMDSAQMVQFLMDHLGKKEDTLKYQTGMIQLGEIATLTVPKGFKYLDPKQSLYVLTDLWGNPTEPNLGMLFPENMHPLDDNCWAIEINFQDQGHIADDEANDLDAEELLNDLKGQQEQANAARKKENLPLLHVAGWAEKPHYDLASKCLYWGLDLTVDSVQEHTLNYNLRFLGRTGMLTMNVIGTMQQLPEIQKNTAAIVGSINFKDGKLYTNFDASKDKKADYGLRMLVSGSKTERTNFFSKYGFWVLGGLALVFGGWIWRGRK